MKTMILTCVVTPIGSYKIEISEEAMPGFQKLLVNGAGDTIIVFEFVENTNNPAIQVE